MISLIKIFSAEPGAVEPGPDPGPVEPDPVTPGAVTPGPGPKSLQRKKRKS